MNDPTSAHAIVRKAFTASQLSLGEFAMYVAKQSDETVRAWLANTVVPSDEVIRFFEWFNGLTAFQRRAYVDSAMADHHASLWTPPPPSRLRPSQ